MPFKQFSNLTDDKKIQVAKSNVESSDLKHNIIGLIFKIIFEYF